MNVEQNAALIWLQETETTEKHRLFVYGTLMKGKRNHAAFMKNAEYLGEASIYGFALYDFGRCPGIIHSDEPRLVYGELYEVDDDDYDAICVHEGNGSVYQCEAVPVILNHSGEWMPAKTFVFLGSVYENDRIPGDLQVWNT